ncbi:Helix-turn-helix domain protein [Caballeronia calidae]|uniref:Helix-turn-helix domain protein n=1 Tax=Caballeronia calidae TaxID=1777139 RepID=A0A158D415_9BURK|nr:helix-turn-helix domain-containing protein [Caballeronia calidae]SAK89241.1 Helix-turn-helix domain protein [Caballeronia calidae]
MMKTVTIGIASLEEVGERVMSAVKSGKFQGHFFSYATPELLFRTFTTPRWQIIRAMTGAGPMSIRELSRRLERDVKGVHRDVKALLEAGLLEHDEHGAIVFPFDTVHVNFTLKAADLAPSTAARNHAHEAPGDAESAQPPRSPRRRAAPRKREPRPAGNR